MTLALVQGEWKLVLISSTGSTRLASFENTKSLNKEQPKGVGYTALLVSVRTMHGGVDEVARYLLNLQSGVYTYRGRERKRKERGGGGTS